VKSIAAILLALLLAMPAVAQNPVACASPASAMIRTTLYFGLSIPGGGKVGKTQWRRFLGDVVTPRFPQGFTILDAHGQWRGADGRIAGEDTRLLLVVHPATDAAGAALQEIASTYKQLFPQEAVGREDEPVCAAF
jgi:hypothetical protein